MPQTRRAFLSLAISVPALALMGQHALAMNTSIYAENGIAVDGTDVVAYFKEGQPVAGQTEFSTEWNGVTWLFSSAENKADFIANPEAFAPQYGGFCAYAVSEGYTASTVPHAWHIEDGKLYLNYSRRVQRIWERDIPGRISAADGHWPKLQN